MSEQGRARASGMTVFLAAAALCLVPSVVTGDYLEEEHELSTAFVTPHTEWAKPYCGGKLRVLFFAAWQPGTTRGRDMVELMQRFDIEADAAYYLVRDKKWLGDKAGHERILRLLQKPYDVYVFWGVAPKELAAEEQARVLEAVTDGGGTVFIGTEDEGVLKPESKLKELPAFLSSGDCYTVGKGRGIRLPKGESIAYRVGWEVEYDYRAERWGRALLWAAGRVPQMGLEVSGSGTEIARTDLPSQCVAVRWRNARPGTVLDAALRRWDGQKTGLGNRECGSPQGNATFGIPALRAGEYHVDVIAKREQGVECWATASFTVTSQRVVEAVKLGRDWGEVGDELSGEVQLSGQALAGERLTVRLMDRRGRVLVRKDVKVGGDSVPFAFRIEAWMPMLLRVEAALASGEQEVASSYAYFRVTKRHRGQFNFIVWDYPRGDLGPYGLENMARMGTTAILSGGSPPLSLAAYEMAYVPYATWVGADFFTLAASLDKNGVMGRTGCWNDEARIQKHVDTIVDNYRPARSHGVLAYSLGDEVAVRGSCLSPHCLDAYRRYLRQVYGSIGALNEEWGTEFDSFDDVQLSEVGELPARDAPEWFKTYYKERLEVFEKHYEKRWGRKRPLNQAEIKLGDKNDEVPALQAENYPRWYDRQAFQCYNLVQFCKRFAVAFRKIDPEALTGFEGTNSFAIPRNPTRIRQGGDVDLIVRELGWWGPYPGPAGEVVRSIASPGFLYGNWMGYAKDAGSLLSKYWMMITRGMTQVQWWMWSGVGRFHGFLAPHLGPYPATREMLEDTRVVRDGLGTLLVKSEMLDDGIAMLYSMPSTYVAHFDGNRSYGSYRGAHQSCFRAIRDGGLQFRYVTDRMLRLGEFEADRYRVLILPLALAMGKKEAEVIRDFVRNGGALIADVRPATYDGHCKPLSEGLLDDVFGIKRDGKENAVAAPIKVEGTIGRQVLDAHWDGGKADPAVRVTTGRALGTASGVPACVVHEFGKGRAVLLNFTVTTPEARGLLQRLLVASGVAPRLALRTPDGEGVEGVEVGRWRNGGIELVSLFGSYGGAVHVELPAGRCVYDLRHRKALGRVKSFATELMAGRASFFALLPEESPAVRVELEPAEASPGTVVRARLSVPGAAGKHAVRIRVTTPDGRRADWQDQVVIVSKEPAEVHLPIAYNDPRGVWVINAIDLFTDAGPALKLHVR